jgi:hypothetical protein
MKFAQENYPAPLFKPRPIPRHAPLINPKAKIEIFEKISFDE